MYFLEKYYIENKYLRIYLIFILDYFFVYYWMYLVPITSKDGMIIGIALALIVVIVGVISCGVFIKKAHLLERFLFNVQRRRGRVPTCGCREVIDMKSYV